MSRSDPEDGSLLRNVFCDDQLKKRLRRKNRIEGQRQAKKSRIVTKRSLSNGPMKWGRSRQLYYNPVIRIQLQKTNFDRSCILN